MPLSHIFAALLILPPVIDWPEPTNTNPAMTSASVVAQAWLPCSEEQIKVDSAAYLKGKNLDGKWVCLSRTK
jgi:hypothetical protein